jgi:hypothetical protein
MNMTKVQQMGLWKTLLDMTKMQQMGTPIWKTLGSAPMGLILVECIYITTHQTLYIREEGNHERSSHSITHLHLSFVFFALKLTS